MLIGVLWVAFAIAVGMLASKRGRGSGNWFLVSLLASPLLGVIFLFAMEDLSGSSPATHVQCLACAEPVLREATKCKHCGSALTPQPVDIDATRKAAAKKEIALAFWIVIILCAIYFVLR